MPELSPSVLAWHWEGEYSGSVVDPIGVTRVERRVAVGRYGLHASPCPLSALRFAVGGTLQRVRLSGTIDAQKGGALGGHCNHAATERTALATLTAEQTERVVRAWLFRCIEHTARPAAIRSLRRAAEQDVNADRKAVATQHADALESLPAVVDAASCKRFEEAASRAASAAWDAARESGWANAWDVARDAAWATTRCAAWANARCAAWANAWATARDVARDVARESAWWAVRRADWETALAAMGNDLHNALMAALAEQGYEEN